MSDLAYIAKDELARLLCLRTTIEKQIEIFAAACRLNTLYMIARAGSPSFMAHLPTRRSAPSG